MLNKIFKLWLSVETHLNGFLEAKQKILIFGLTFTKNLISSCMRTSSFIHAIGANALGKEEDFLNLLESTFSALEKLRNALREYF